MNKKITVLVLVLAIMLSGCSIIKLGDQNSELKALQELGLAYKEGTYNMEKIYVSGFITEYQTIIWLGIPVGKKLVDGQKVSVT